MIESYQVEHFVPVDDVESWVVYWETVTRRSLDKRGEKTMLDDGRLEYLICQCNPKDGFPPARNFTSCFWQRIITTTTSPIEKFN